MPERTVARRLARKGANRERLAAEVIQNHELVPQLIECLTHAKASVRFGSARVLRIVSERAPVVLYPRIDALLSDLDHENRILRWNRILVIGNLAGVDSYRKIDDALDRYLKPIRGPELITATHVIRGATEIARAKPELANRVVDALLGVETARYRTPECRNIAAGHAILALGALFEQTARREKIVAFVRKQLENSKSATRKKAGRFLKKWVA